MLADHVDVVEAVEQHLAGPVGRRKIVGNILAVDAPGLVGSLHHVGHGAAGNELDGRIDLAHLLGEEVVLQFELRQRHGAHLVVAPGLVADAPELDVVGLRMTVCGAPFAHRRGGGAVGVFDQFARGPRVAEAGIDGDVGIDAEQTAEREELVGADVVRLHGVPDGIEDGRTLVDVADAVAPLVRGDEVAAGKAKDAEAQLLERGDDFGRKPSMLSAGMSETAPT